tara:strand:- start:884 stop:2017 length:1134 start_codon:yes stop_codon:yes gene_type:complete
MPAKIFSFGLKHMSSKGKLFAYLTVVFNFLLFFSYLGYLANPLKSSWIPFVALLYPLILFINFFLVLIWISKRKLFFLPTLILIILGMYHHSRFFQFYASSEKYNHSSILHVMSYNVRLFDLYNWNENEKSKAEIFKLIQVKNPDILCLQEYYFTNDENLPFETRNLILDSLGFKYYYESFSEESKENKFFGIATFSKYPIVNRYNKQFKNDNSNQFIYTDIKKDQDTIRVYNAHLGSIRFNHTDYKVIGGKGSPIWPHQKSPKRAIFSKIKIGFEKRTVQVKELIHNIENSPYKTIICADMNDTPTSYCYNAFDRNFIDAFTVSGKGFGGTYIGNIPGLRIDYIWHDKSLGSTNFMVHEQKLSDHKAISTDIVLPN